MKKFVTLMLVLLSINSLFAADQETVNLMRQALQLADQNKHDEAITVLDTVLKREPTYSYALYLRGREKLRIGKIDGAVADLNEHVRLDPKLESRQWERGIALYYAGKFAEGAKQFEDYQSYHDQDVENSVWRYLCSAKIVGVEKARENMLPIERDGRVPMMEVFDLFRGKKTPEEVLAAAKAGMPTAGKLEMQMFYADLYLGLYYDSLGKLEKAREHINQAAEHAHVAEYMGNIARVHAQHLKKQAENTKK